MKIQWGILIVGPEGTGKGTRRNTTKNSWQRICRRKRKI